VTSSPLRSNPREEVSLNIFIDIEVISRLPWVKTKIQKAKKLIKVRKYSTRQMDGRIMMFKACVGIFKLIERFAGIIFCINY
jgi:hypothetical protein